MHDLFFRAARRLRAAFITAGLVAAAGSAACASDLNVQPLSVHLKSNHTSDTITIENRGTAAVRLQVTGFAWDQDTAGAMKLEPTRDLVFFPLLLTIDPGKKRSVRVGLQSTAPTMTERTFRVFFEELPSIASQLVPETTGVTLLSKFGVPVFLDPVKISPRPNVAVQGGEKGLLLVTTSNAGNAHYISTAVAISGRDVRGAQLFDRSERGWYVLAHGERTYAVPLDRKECTGLHDVIVELKTTAGSMKQTLPVSPASCPK